MARWGAVPGSTGLSPRFPPPALTADIAELADALIPLIPEDGSRITNDEIRFHGDDSNSSYVDPHDSVGAFDYVMANPPFNVNAVDMARLSGAVGPGRRFPFGTPSVDNANYLCIQLFYSSLNEKGRAGFVMANSASDARSLEQAIRQKLIEAKAEDVSLGGEEAQRWIEAYFGSESGEAPGYRDIPGLCKAASIEVIDAQGWSLNPGRSVGVAAGEDLSDEEFKE
jgi:type I restriction-modification system DNA methylase subunit